MRATGSATRCCRCCARSGPVRKRRSPRPRLSWPRRRRRSSGWPPRRLRSPVQTPRERSAGKRSPRWTRRSGGWCSAGWQRAPRARRCHSADRGRRRSGGSSTSPEGGVVELGGGVEARAEHGHVRFTSEPERGAGGGDPGGPGRLPLRLLGGARRARGRRAAGGRARTSRCSTRPRWAARSPCGHGATATGCGRSGSAAASPCRTSSPTARFRARCGTRCRSSPPRGGSPGSPASRSPRSSPRRPDAQESAVLSATQTAP